MVPGCSSACLAGREGGGDAFPWCGMRGQTSQTEWAEAVLAGWTRQMAPVQGINRALPPSESPGNQALFAKFKGHNF